MSISHERELTVDETTILSESDSVYLNVRPLTIDPAEFIFVEWINFGKVTSLVEVDGLCAKYPSFERAFRKTLNGLIETGIVEVKNGRLIKKVSKVDLNCDPEQLVNFLPDLAQRSFERVIEDYLSGVADKKSDIAQSYAFPDDEETRAAVAKACIDFCKRLGEIQSRAKERNKKFDNIRLINLSSGRFALEDC